MTLFIPTSLGPADSVCWGRERLLEGDLQIRHSRQEQGARHLFLGSTCQARPAAKCWDSTWHLEEPALSLIWRRATHQEGVGGAGPPYDTICNTPEDHQCLGTQAHAPS